MKSTLSCNFFEKEPTSYTLSMVYVGKRKDIDEKSQKTEMPSYTLFDTAITHKIKEVGEIQFTVKNILDKKYEEVYGYGTLGRNYYLSLTYSL